MRNLLFLINPHAGKSEIKTCALDIIDLFTKNGWRTTVRTTQRRLEIPEILAEEAQNYELVVCCGGDGTLNETVSGLMLCDPRPMLGYIPAGTVNDFASSLHIPKNMRAAAQNIVSGIPFSCDIGRFGDRFFTYVAAFGAFTDVAYETPQQSKNLLGRAAYVLEGVKRLPSLKSYPLRVEHDSGCVEGDFLLGMVTNATSVGGFRMGDRIGVELDDGLLEVLLIRNPENAVQAQQTINALLRRDFSSGCITGVRTRRARFFCGSETPWTLDGEFGGASEEVVIENLPRALKILVEQEPGLLKE